MEKSLYYEHSINLWHSQTKTTLRMARCSTTDIFGNNVDESLTRCNQENVEYSIASGRESLRMKTQ